MLFKHIDCSLLVTSRLFTISTIGLVEFSSPRPQTIGLPVNAPGVAR